MYRKRDNRHFMKLRNARAPRFSLQSVGEWYKDAMHVPRVTGAAAPFQSNVKETNFIVARTAHKIASPQRIPSFVSNLTHFEEHLLPASRNLLSSSICTMNRIQSPLGREFSRGDIFAPCCRVCSSNPTIGSEYGLLGRRISLLSSR